MNYEGIVSFAFDWLKARDSLKILLPYGALSAVMVLISVLEQNFQKNVPVSSSLYPVGLFVSIGLLILFWLVSFYFVGLALAFALKIKKRRPRFFGCEEYIEFIKVAIVSFFRSLIWCQNTKIRAAQVSGFSVSLVSLLLLVLALPSRNSLVIIPLILVLFLVAFAYLLVVVYASIRYGFSVVAFLDKRTEVADSVKQSWEITRGSVLQILFASILAVLVSGIAFGAVALLLSIFCMLFGIIAGAGLLLSFTIFAVIFDFLLRWLVFLPQIFIDVAIYENLLASHSKPKR